MTRISIELTFRVLAFDLLLENLSNHFVSKLSPIIVACHISCNVVPLVCCISYLILDPSDRLPTDVYISTIVFQTYSFVQFVRSIP